MSCGRRADQKTYCWGSSNLGDATSGAKRVPGIAALGRSFTNATYGASWGCGIDTGAAWCWGTNGGAGYLGNGGTDAPLLMPVPVSGGHTFTAISAGASHTCALDSGGAAWCWGMQLGGALGDGVIATTNGEYKTTPTAVLGGITFASLSVGQSHSCGLTAAGVAWCWGLNLSGQLGDGTTTTRAQPTQVGGGLTFASISAGGNHTCALTAAGKPYCWGSYSQIGDATAPTQDVKAPRAIPTTDTFAEISAGWNHSCAITTSGTAYCWGNNFYGQLGNGASGASANSRALVPVSGGLSFAKIAVRNQVSCGVTTANAVRCWGFNTGGQVGDGTTTHRSTPMLVKTY
jgi:alpha-tubulin suppressor-like RCC1 family protein